MDNLCDECRLRMYPEDPRVPVFISLGRYHKPICYSCSNYDPGEVEEAKPQEIIHRYSDMSKKEFDLLQQTAFELKHLRKEVTELQAKKQPVKYTIK